VEALGAQAVHQTAGETRTRASLVATTAEDPLPVLMPWAAMPGFQSEPMTRV